MYDLNIYSIFEYLNEYKMNGFKNKDLLEITDSKYLINENIPKLNKNFNESNIFDNLITFYSKGLYSEKTILFTNLFQ